MTESIMSNLMRSKLSPERLQRNVFFDSHSLPVASVVARTVCAVLPILSCCQSTNSWLSSSWFSHGLTGARFAVLLHRVVVNKRNEEEVADGQEREIDHAYKRKLGLEVGLVVGELFFPKNARMVKGFCTVAVSGYGAYKTFVQKEKSKLRATVQLACTLVQWVACFSSKKEWILLSLTMQVAQNSQDAYRGWKRGLWIEAVGKGILAVFDAWAAKSLIKACLIELFPPQLDQPSLDAFLKQAREEGYVDKKGRVKIHEFVEAKLKGAEEDAIGGSFDKKFFNVSSDPWGRQVWSDVKFKGALEVEGVNFSRITVSNSEIESVTFTNCVLPRKLSGCELKNISLENCEAPVSDYGYYKPSDWVHIHWQQGRISDTCLKGLFIKDSVLEDVVMQDVNAEGLRAAGSQLIRSSLNEVIFRGGAWMNGRWEEVAAQGGDCSEVDFYKSAFCGVDFFNTKLRETMWFRTRIDGEKGVCVEQSDCKGSFFLNLANTIEFKDGQPEQTQPAVLLCWDYDHTRHFASKEKEVLEQYNHIMTLPISSFPEEVNPVALEREVNEVLEQLPENRLLHPEDLFSYQGKELAKVRSIAKEVVAVSDGVIIPGGHDVEPKLYGANNGGASSPERDIRCSVMEIALLAEAELQSLPAMGICRGMQLLNVAYGGALNQRVFGQFRVWQPLIPDASQQEIAPWVSKEGILGLSMHYQAVETLGKDFHTVLQTWAPSGEEVPKLVLGDESRLIGAQFHPEEALDESSPTERGDQVRNGLAVFDYFSERVREAFFKKQRGAQAA